MISRFQQEMYDFRKRLIAATLLRFKWNKTHTATYLGIARTRLYELIEYHDIRRPE